jgi:hypothetical protein
MKSTENVEKFVRDKKPRVTTGRQMDKQVLDDSFAAMEETFRVKSKACQLSVRSVFLQNRTMKLAAAAVIVVVTGLVLTRNGQRPNGTTPEPQLAAQSPTWIVSMMSLRMAYQEGGLDALDRQFRETLNTFGPGSSSLSMGQLLQNSNGL